MHDVEEGREPRPPPAHPIAKAGYYPEKLIEAIRRSRRFLDEGRVSRGRPRNKMRKRKRR